jgi:ribosomal protein S18 acetylase RimI-like enzyme
LRRLAAAPGTVSLVAIRTSTPTPAIVGFAHALTNGHHAYLSVVVVDPSVRGLGVGRQLVAAVFEISGVQRMDLLSGPESEGFYDRLPNRRMTGYRLFPGE